MKRHVSVVLARVGIGAAALSVALIGVAPAAQAITNPAQHPAPVTVTIGGQTYHDGQDTLPGYDDEACTAIPDVQYDFGANEIDYYDDDGTLLDSAHWTEWSRISSYETWLKQQQPSSSPSSTAKSTTAPASGKTTSSTPKQGGSSSTRTSTTPTRPSTNQHNSTGSAGTGPTSAAAGPGSTAIDASSTGTGSARSGGTSTSSSGGAIAAAGAGAAGSPTGSEVGAAGSEVASQPAAALAAQKQKLGKAVISSVGRGAGNTRLAGVGVLGALAAACLIALLGGFVRRQTFTRRAIKGTHS